MIIFINGSINAGKSTVAKIIVDKCPKTALFEPDLIDEMMIGSTLDQKLPVIYNLIPKIIKELLRGGFNVVVPYVFTESRYHEITKELGEISDPIYFITLSPKIEIALTNRGARELNNWEKERVVYHYKIGVASPTIGTIIDNSSEQPEETAKRIMSILNLSQQQTPDQFI